MTAVRHYKYREENPHFHLQETQDTEEPCITFLTQETRAEPK